MSSSIYLTCTVLIAVLAWLVLTAAWGKDVGPLLRLPLALTIALLWPLILVGLLIIGVLIFINKPRKP